MEGGIRRQDLAIAEVTESLAIRPLLGEALDDRGEFGHGTINRDAGW